MFWCSKELSHNDIEMVLLSTHNICFDREIRKIIFSYALLFGGQFNCIHVTCKSLAIELPKISVRWKLHNICMIGVFFFIIVSVFVVPLYNNSQSIAL